MSQRILIAGCGDIGILLGDQLAQQGHQVYGLRRNIKRLPSTIDGIAADLSDPTQLTSLPTIDILVYCVSANQRSKASYQQAYIDGLQNLYSQLQLAALQRLIFVSSSAVYHQNDHEWVNETSPTQPSRFNGQLMLQAEQQVLALPTPSTIVRFSGIYGPGRTHLLEQIQQGNTAPPQPLIYTNRIHRDDCAAVLLHLIKRHMQDQPLDDIYLASDCAPSTLHDVSNWLGEQLQVQSQSGLSRQTASKRCANQRLLETGYQFKYLSYKDGYPSLIEAFLQAQQDSTSTEAS